MVRGCRVNGGPLGALDSFEGSMCGITHKMSRSCMTCMTIHDVKNVIILIQRVIKKNSITFLGTHKSGVVVVLVLSESEVLGWNVKNTCQGASMS